MKDQPPKPGNKSKITVSDALQTTLRAFLRYSIIFFLLLILAVYGFITFRIYLAGNASPTDTAVDSQSQATTTPRIDPKIVKQMQSLQDRSINVKTLFDQARNNPFGE